MDFEADFLTIKTCHIYYFCAYLGMQLLCSNCTYYEIGIDRVTEVNYLEY